MHLKVPGLGVVAKALMGLAWIGTNVGIHFCFGLTLAPPSLRVETIILSLLYVKSAVPFEDKLRLDVNSLLKLLHV